MNLANTGPKKTIGDGFPAALLLALILPACDADTNVQSDLGRSDAAINRVSDLGHGDVSVSPSLDVGTPDADQSPSSPECGQVPLTQWEQKMLDAHNRWRVSVEPTAANMYRVYWDRNIAQNAADWVSNCDPTWPHSPEDQRRNVGGYEVLGENLSFCGGSGCAMDPNITDGSGMGDGEGWWEERNDYHWADDTSTGDTAHYTLMVSSNTYAIGCATQRCSAPGPFDWDGEWWWVICQYGPRGQAYWAGTKPYDAGEGGLVEPPADVFEVHCLQR